MTSSQINEIFDKTSFLHGVNTAYIEEMFEKFQTDPNNVPNDWKEFFLGITQNIKNQNSLKASWSQEKEVEFSNGDLVSAIDGNWSREVHSKSIEIDNRDFLTEEIKNQTLDSIGAIRLIRAFRVNGHLVAKLDPLNLKEVRQHPELDYRNYGFSDEDLNKSIFVDGSLGLHSAKLSEIIKILGETYSGSIGVEFVHIQDPDQKQWVQERIEEVRNKTHFTDRGKIAIYRRLLEAEMFEKFLDKKYLGTKRFGLVGSESTIPGIEQIIKQSCLSGIEDIYIGTAHRGRLTLLSSVMEVPLRSIMA